MDRVLGRAQDLKSISEELKKMKTRICLGDVKAVTIDDVRDSFSKYSIYIPESAKDYLRSRKIIVKKPGFLTTTAVNSGVFCTKRFPTVEDESEFAFFIGRVLANYRNDARSDGFSFPAEYAALLPMLMEYLYCKETEREEIFYKQYLNRAKKDAKTFLKESEEYRKEMEKAEKYNTVFSTESSYRMYNFLSMNAGNTYHNAVLDAVYFISGLEALLQVNDKYKTESEIRDLIEVLFRNEGNDRSAILYDLGIDSYGYRAIRKHIEEGKKR